MHSRLSRMSSVLAIGLVFGLVFAMLVVAPPARAVSASVAWSPYTSLIGGLGTMTNETPSVVADTSGHVYVFYYHQGLGVFNVYVMKYQDEGTSGAVVPVPGFPVQVNSVANTVYGAPNGIWSPYGAIDASGNLYATWFSTSLNVFVSRSADGGKTWSAQVMANPASSANEDIAPSIAVAPNGRVYVAWYREHLTNVGYLYNISVSYSNDGGATFTGAQNVSGGASPPYHWIGHPSIAVDSHGRIYVVYTQWSYTGSLPAWVNYTYSDDGVTWSPPVTLNSGTLEGMNPRIAIDAQNHVDVVWVDGRTGAGGQKTIYYTTSADRGQTWSTPIPLTQGYFTVPSGYYYANVEVASEGDTLLVVWDAQISSNNYMGYVLSANDGGTWNSENYLSTGGQAVTLDADGNGTFYAFSTDFATTPASIGLTWWHSPPSHPIATVTPGTSSLTVSWTAPPETDIVAYHVWRSSDGSSYSLVATVSAGVTSYTDSGLANGTYWYHVDAVDAYGYIGNPSPSVAGVVGPTVAQLEDEITSLQAELNSANANLGAIQGQLANLRDQVKTLQGNTTALLSQIAALQSQLNTLQSQQATQTLSYANLAFEVIVVVLLVVLLLNQMRKPKNPTLMMAQPGQVAPPPKNPEDEL